MTFKNVLSIPVNWLIVTPAKLVWEMITLPYTILKKIVKIQVQNWNYFCAKRKYKKGFEDVFELVKYFAKKQEETRTFSRPVGVLSIPVIIDNIRVYENVSLKQAYKLYLCYNDSCTLSISTVKNSLKCLYGEEHWYKLNGAPEEQVEEEEIDCPELSEEDVQNSECEHQEPVKEREEDEEDEEDYWDDEGVEETRGDKDV